MKILVGKCFGLGNCILTVPLIKALNTFGEVSVLIGSTADDGGALDVMLNLQDKYIKQIWIDSVDTSCKFDVAIMAIPFDGRWVNGIHYSAGIVLDGRTRPDPSTIGFVSWQKHEILYQLENVSALAGSIGKEYDMHVPSMSFFEDTLPTKEGLVYVGLGYKRDAAGFWAQKHWGNDRYTKFINTLCDEFDFIATGNAMDLVEVARHINTSTPNALQFQMTSLKKSWKLLSSCEAYFGNDTGMLHAAASMGKPCYWLSNMDGTDRKSPPWGVSNVRHDFSDGLSDPVNVAKDFANWLKGFRNG